MKKRSIYILILLCIVLGTMQTLSAQVKRHNQVSKFIYSTSVGVYNAFNDIECEQRELEVKTTSVSVQQMIGFQFNNYLSLGVVAGVDVWKRTAFIPICGAIHVNFLNRNWTPTWYAQAGYAFKWYVESMPEIPDLVIHGSNPGAHFETGAGVRVNLNSKVALLFTFNYKLQQSTINYSVTPPAGEIDYSHYATNRTQDALYHFMGAKFTIIY